MTDTISSKCARCETPLIGMFCYQCGHAQKIKRIDSHFVWHELMHVLHVEKGIFYTLRELLLRPGLTVRTFINEERNRLVKPLLFLILSSLAYTVIANFWPVQIQILGNAAHSTSAQQIRHWVQTHYGYANFLMAIVIAVCVRLVFWRQKYNIFEIWVLLAYVMGVGMLLLGVTLPLNASFPQIPYFRIALTLACFTYIFVAVAAFFDGSRWMNLLKAALAYVAGLVMWYGLIEVLGWFLDFLH